MFYARDEQIQSDVLFLRKFPQYKIEDLSSFSELMISVMIKIALKMEEKGL